MNKKRSNPRSADLRRVNSRKSHSGKSGSERTNSNRNNRAASNNYYSKKTMQKKLNKKNNERRRRNERFSKRPKAALVILCIVILYVVIFISLYMSKQKVKTYEVNTGSLISNASFSGVILREEQIFNSDYSGNINYYQREGSRVRVDDTIYTVDETGRVSEILSQYTQDGENSLSENSLNSIKVMINSFRTGYDGSNFDNIYDLKTDINATILQSMNEQIMANLNNIIKDTGSADLFRTIKTSVTGLILYYTDGYEALKPEDINHDAFDKTKYSKNNLTTQELIVKNSPAYKLVTDEQWYVMIELTQDDIAKYELNSKSSVKVKIKKDNVTLNGSFSIINKDGSYYGKIGLNQYLIRYANERFLDIELVSSSVSGLKLPASAITDSEFYIIPKEYLTTGGNSSNSGFICENYDSSGESVTTFIPANIYKTSDKYCYVSMEEFKSGANIIMPDSNNRYVIGPTDRLKGVYCINTGYTDFKVVDIIDSNNEYVIVRKGLSFSINVYDRILLDASNFRENEIVY